MVSFNVFLKVSFIILTTYGHVWQPRSVQIFSVVISSSIYTAFLSDFPFHCSFSSSICNYITQNSLVYGRSHEHRWATSTVNMAIQQQNAYKTRSDFNITHSYTEDSHKVTRALITQWPEFYGFIYYAESLFSCLGVCSALTSVYYRKICVTFLHLFVKRLVWSKD